MLRGQICIQAANSLTHNGDEKNENVGSAWASRSPKFVKQYGESRHVVENDGGHNLEILVS